MRFLPLLASLLITLTAQASPGKLFYINLNLTPLEIQKADAKKIRKVFEYFAQFCDKEHSRSCLIGPTLDTCTTKASLEAADPRPWDPNPVMWRREHHLAGGCNPPEMIKFRDWYLSQGETLDDLPYGKDHDFMTHGTAILQGAFDAGLLFNPRHHED